MFAPLLALVLVAGAARAEDTLSPLTFQSQGPLGSIDIAAAQRGLAVYQGVCAGCHGLSAVHYRDLAGLGFSPDQIAALAPGGDANAAFGAGGAMGAPDLSDIVSQREAGTVYVYRLLTGFAPAPADVTLLPGRSYNTAYPGQQTAMPDVLHDNAVKYADGTPATSAQEAADVAEFLTWAAEPDLTARHQIGLRALIFFAFLSLVAFAALRSWTKTP